MSDSKIIIEARKLEIGFNQLNEEDQQMLRHWYSVPESSSTFALCCVIAAQAPEVIRATIGNKYRF
jgi:hypothetical protein